MRGILFPVAAAAFAVLVGLVTVSPDSSSAGGEELNFVVVVSDDQTASSIERMPWLASRPDWQRFDRAYVNQPWCCPSRVSILTGQYAHHHGVIGNSRFAREWDDSETIATALDRGGYETGLFGKYLNSFPWQRRNTYVPPGWDRWLSFLDINGAFYEYTLGVDGRRVAWRGSAPQHYSTTVFSKRTASFARTAREPFFAMLSPYAPHRPATPAPGDEGAFAGVPVEKPPNFNQVAADQPQFYRDKGRAEWSEMRAKRRQAWAATLGVDRGLRRVFRAVRERGALDRTVFVFIGDNGYSFGSHRYKPKNCLYEECARVPLAIRMPQGFGARVTTPVSNVDLAPTIAELAGVKGPPGMDGESLAAQLSGAPWPPERDLLLEVHASKQGVPPGYAIVTERWKHTRLRTGERELYDLIADPYEMENLAGDPAYAPIEADLRDRLRALRDR